jgi:hypothetical protein
VAKLVIFMINLPNKKRKIIRRFCDAEKNIDFMGRGKMVHLLIPFNVVSRNHWGY